jgi:hypothetical protein
MTSSNGLFDSKVSRVPAKASEITLGVCDMFVFGL